MSFRSLCHKLDLVTVAGTWVRSFTSTENMFLTLIVLRYGLERKTYKIVSRVLLTLYPFGRVDWLRQV